MLSIRLFGPFEAHVNDQPLKWHHSRKEQWLLALLILRRDQRVPRDWLAGELWPDSMESQAKSSLRQTLYFVRKSLGVEAFRLESPTPRSLSFNCEGADIDVVHFDRLATETDLQKRLRAASLFRGSLLEDCMEEWSSEYRLNREQRYLSLLEGIARDAAVQSEYETARRALQSLIQADPLRESAVQSLMLLQSHIGESAGVTAAFRDLRVRLREAVNQEPTTETVELYQQLRRQTQQKMVVNRQNNTPSSQEPLHRTTTTNQTAPARIPQNFTPLIGRDRLVREIVLKLKHNRLVSLTGTGGVGKTRVATAVASEIESGEHRPVWFVELAPILDEAHFSTAVARSLGVKENSSLTVEERIMGFLSSQPGLLVLDNCEHLISEAALFAGNLLNTCPELCILTTSRQLIGIAGEVAIAVPPLSIPQTVHANKEVGNIPVTLERDWMEFDSIRLFVQRAQAGTEKFKLDNYNCEIIAEICSRLDGIPLAIELAAARVRVLSLKQILDRLSDRFKLLSGRDQSIMPHHQTLKLSIDWSYDLLTEQERHCFQRLSVFVGGWTLSFAEPVCAILDDISESDVLDLLASLVDKSLVIAEPGTPAPRFRMLETLRQYALEQLVLSGDSETVRAAHCTVFLNWAEEVAKELRGSVTRARLDALEIENDNLRAAIQWCLANHGTTQEALRFAGALTAFWIYRGHLREGAGICQSALQRDADELPTAARADALATAGSLAWLLGKMPEAIRFHTQSLDIRRSRNDQSGIAHSMERLGITTFRMGDTEEGIRLLSTALELAKVHGDYRTLSNAMMNLGCAFEGKGELDQATAIWEECLTIVRGREDLMGLALCAVNLGGAALARKDYDKAKDYTTESLGVMMELGDSGGIAIARFSLGQVELGLGNVEGARSWFLEATRAWNSAGNLESLVMGWEALACIEIRDALKRSDCEDPRIIQSLKLLSYAARTKANGNLADNFETKADVDECLSWVRTCISPRLFADYWAAGQSLTPEQAMQIAEEMHTLSPDAA